MMRRTLLLALFVQLSLAVPALSQTTPQCKIRFSVVRKDTLNNIQQGLVGDDLKWMQTKMAQKYPDVCYVSSTTSAPVLFFIALAKDTYHGTRTVTETHTTEGTVQGTVTDTTAGSGTYGQQVGTVSGTTEGTTTTSHQVPYSFPYTVLTLFVETPEADGKWKVRHTFQNNSIHYQMYGIAVTNRHPYHSLVEQGIQWIHGGGLENAPRAVLAPEARQESSFSAVPLGNSSSSGVSTPTVKLSVSSVPQGADIEMDGSFVGNTPSELSVTEGEHTLEIKKAGFKPWERKLKTNAGSTIHLDAELEKAAN
jgi:hypothetical protein